MLAAKPGKIIGIILDRFLSHWSTTFSIQENNRQWFARVADHFGLHEITIATYAIITVITLHWSTIEDDRYNFSSDGPITLILRFV